MKNLLDQAVQHAPAETPVMAVLDRIAGPRRTALRRPGQRTWIIVERSHLAGDVLPLGLQIELDRSDAGRGDGFGAQRSMSPWAPGLRPPQLRSVHAVLLAGGLLALAVIGFARGAGTLRLSFAEAVQDLGALGLVLLIAYAVILSLRLAEGAVAGSELVATVPWMRIPGLLPRVEPVCWRLGVSRRVSTAVAALPVCGFLAASAWRGTVPTLSAGAATGCLLYLILALYPLRPGIGSSLLEDQLRVRDLPNRLRWTLISRFAPVPSGLTVGGSQAMVTAALATVAWAVGTGGLLYWISLPPAEGGTLEGKLWQALFALLLLGYTTWLVWRALSFAVAALRLGDPVKLRPTEPSEALLRAWTDQNPLTHHLPALRNARWAWRTAPAGAVLILHGAEDRHFLWLAHGSADVLARTPTGDPILVAELRGGFGVGEVALLEGGARTADVIASGKSVVGILEHEEFERVADEDTRARFRDLVRASQSLARAPTLWGLAPDDRAVWLSGGSPERYAAGDTLIRQGEDARWMGLVVDGRVSITLDGEKVGELGPDELFGEIAYLHQPPRRATLTAETDVLVWRWDPEFLDRNIGTGELRNALGRLAMERSA